MNPLKIALTVAILGSVSLFYEAWAIWMEQRHPNLTLTITNLTKKHTHLMLIAFTFSAMLLGYALGVGEAWR
jgi:hypothetical protein